MITSPCGNWIVNGVGGRAPKCENCNALPASKRITGTSVICTFLLCAACYEDLAGLVIQAEAEE